MCAEGMGELDAHVAEASNRGFSELSQFSGLP
jgi:hypothetical protein